jgi:hypothetical protein
LTKFVVAELLSAHDDPVLQAGQRLSEFIEGAAAVPQRS